MPVYKLIIVIYGLDIDISGPALFDICRDKGDKIVKARGTAKTAPQAPALFTFLLTYYIV